MKKELRAFAEAKQRVDAAIEAASRFYIEAVQAIANKHKVFIVTGHLSDIWQVGKKWGEFQAEYDNPKHAAFADLERLDELASEIGIRPSNMERYEPK